jgi:hypothetical protein
VYDNYNNNVNIEWATATETNNSFFTIERTIGNDTYTEVAKVKGAGNSTLPRYYSAVDPSPYNGTAYYRLKQTDFDGQFTYSYLVVVNATDNSKINLFPSPAGGLLNITYYSAAAGIACTLFISDNAGREVVHQSVTSSYSGMNNCTINISNLASGIYIVRFESADRQQIFEKFIKQ